jgi:C4-type Zn-finger protein
MNGQLTDPTWTRVECPRCGAWLVRTMTEEGVPYLACPTDNCEPESEDE